MEVKNRIGNGEAKEIYMTHGYELRGGIVRGKEYWAEGYKGGKLGQL